MATVTKRFRRRKLASLMLVAGVAMMLLAPATGAGADHEDQNLAEHCPEHEGHEGKVEAGQTDNVVNVDGVDVEVVISGTSVTFLDADGDPIAVEFCIKAGDLAGGREGPATSGSVDWANHGDQPPAISYVVVYSVSQTTTTQATTTTTQATTTATQPTTTATQPTTTATQPTTTATQPTTTATQPTTTEQQATTTEQQATTTEQVAGTTVVQATTTEQQATTTEQQATTTEQVAGTTLVQATTTEQQATTTEQVAGTTLVQATTTEAEAADASVLGNVLEREELAATGIASEAWLLAAGLTLGLGGLLLLLGDKDRRTE